MDSRYSFLALVNWKSSCLVYLELFINIVLIITTAEFNLIYMDSRYSFLALVNWKSSNPRVYLERFINIVLIILSFFSLWPTGFRLIIY